VSFTGPHSRRPVRDRSDQDREVKHMKKISVRKPGSIKLTSSAALYSPDQC